MKTMHKLIALALTLALAAFLSVPAFAEPEGEAQAQTETFAGIVPYEEPGVSPPGGETLPGGLEPITPRDGLPAVPETTTQAPATLRPIVTTTAPETTGAAADETPEADASRQPTFIEYAQENLLQLAALAMSGLALLFSVIALARGGKGRDRRRKRNSYF